MIKKYADFFYAESNEPADSTTEITINFGRDRDETSRTKAITPSFSNVLRLLDNHPILRALLNRLSFGL